VTDRASARGAMAWALACAVASSIWCLTAAPRLGATFDEPVYVAAGLDRWRHGGVGGLMRLGTMPLAVDVVSLPVWVAERGRGEPYLLSTDGRGHVVDASDLPRVLPMARAATLIFWWILLASSWRLARGLGGPLAGVLAVVWLCAEPSLLAHATLATTDIAVTAMLLAFAVTLEPPEPSRSASYAASSPRRWLIPGLWFGLALLAKASAIVLAPAIALAFESARQDRDWRAFLARGTRIAVVGLTLAVVYCGSDWQVEESFVAWARSLPSGPAATVLTGTAEHLPIFSNAGEGIVQQIKHNVRGHDTYVLGQTYARAVWFYFPVVLTIKISAAMLVALVAILILRRIQVVNALLVAAVLILVLSPAFRVQTGIRMVLPLVVCAIAGLAVAWAQAIGRAKRRRGVLVASVAAVTLWSVMTAVRAWPDGLTFVNELWGGSDRAHELVSDSNYDWGQGLPALRASVGTGEAIAVWYWGSDPAIREAPFQPIDVRSLAAADEAAFAQQLRGRTLAVSATMLYGSVLSRDARVADEDRAALETAEALRRLLRARQPVGRVGTFFIYRF